MQLPAERRVVLKCLGGGAMAALWLPSDAFAQDDYDSLYTADTTDEAVEQAIDFLVGRQLSNGSISDRRYPVAMTSLAIMAMAAIGVQPGNRSARGKAMAAALDYVLRDGNQDGTGYFGRRDGSRMYGHGITTLMLTEMLGMGNSVRQNTRMHESLAAAIALILKAQRVNKQPRLKGGWRYSPDSADSDLSVSVWQVMALRSAKNDGMDVPGESIEMAVDYLRNSYTAIRLPDGSFRDPVAGFSYMPGSRRGTFAMTAAGLLAMQVCGKYESPLVLGAARWLLRQRPRPTERFFYYGIYYYAQGMHQVGGEFAETAERLTSKLLLKDQRRDGSWHGRSSEERNIGPIYCTALAVLSLSVRYHYLPIYQR